MQRKSGHDKIEALRGKWQGVVLRRHLPRRRKIEAALRRLDIDDVADARQLAKPRGQQTVVGADAGGEREFATHDGEPLDKVVGNAGKEKIARRCIAFGRNTVSPRPDQFLIENLRRAGHRNPSMKFSLPMRHCAKLRQ